MVFLQAVFCTEHFYAFRRIIFIMFLRKKKVENNLPILHGLQTYQNGQIFKMLSQLDYMLFTWAIALLYAVYMGYRLTKIDNLQNALISQLFGVFARNFCRRFLKQNNSMHSVKSFSAFFCEEKVEKGNGFAHFVMAYRLTIMEKSSKCSHISTIWCFCTRFSAQNNSMYSAEAFSACFCGKKKFKITCSFYMGYRVTKMNNLQNALISRLFGVFARSFLHRRTLCIPQNPFKLFFANKKLKSFCPFSMAFRLATMRDLQNALISRLFGVFAGGFLNNNSNHSVESFSACFWKKKS